MSKNVEKLHLAGFLMQAFYNWIRKTTFISPTTLTVGAEIVNHNEIFYHESNRMVLRCRYCKKRMCRAVLQNKKNVPRSPPK